MKDYTGKHRISHANYQDEVQKELQILLVIWLILTGHWQEAGSRIQQRMLELDEEEK